MKTTSPHEGELRAERIRFSDVPFFVYLEALGAMHHHKPAPHDTFFRNHEQNCVPEMSLLP